MRHLVWGCLVVLGALSAAPARAQTREEKVRNDRERVEAEGFWIYNNIELGKAEARKSGKPLLVVLRCIPCEECVKLDDELVDRDPVLRPLLERFVCVRQVSTNGLDLTTFQYDTDQSFAVFMMNADGTIYGRFGTRSDRKVWVGDVSLEGLARALEGALALHAKIDEVRPSLAAKRGPALEFGSPEQYPELRDKYLPQIDFLSGNVVKSCIHCHQIGDAQRTYYRSRGEAIPEHVLFPYPHPKSIGLQLDPRERAKVLEVVEGSPAAKAGLRAGDAIRAMSGQPLLSIADVQWVLQQTPAEGGRIAIELERGGAVQAATLELPKGWRRNGDITWRASTWGLRRMAAGGLVLETLQAAEREALPVPADKMALRVKYVGQYGPHAAAKGAGFQMGDILVSFDGQDDLLTETDLLRHGAVERRPGDKVPVVVLRDGQRKQLALPMQP